MDLVSAWLSAEARALQAESKARACRLIQQRVSESDAECLCATEEEISFMELLFIFFLFFVCNCIQFTIVKSQFHVFLAFGPRYEDLGGWVEPALLIRLTLNRAQENRSYSNVLNNVFRKSRRELACRIKAERPMNT